MLIICLGNTYASNLNQRHNIAIIVANNIANHHGIEWTQKKKFKYFQVEYNDMEYTFAYPITFMNLSGTGVKQIFKNFSKDKYVIMHADLDTKIGKIKMKTGGSSRGHNGIKSCIEKIGNTFTRIRIGISRPKSRDSNIVSGYVLGKFNLEELTIIKKIELNEIIAVLEI
jgi:peptidyl-tRNA hydrolase, PTH1 family